MKLVSGKQMQEIDSKTQNEYGLSSLVLMEQAGERATNFLLTEFGLKSCYLILAGCGNNGGDALVVARRLMLQGASVCTYLVGNRDKLTPQTKTNLSIFEKLGGEVNKLQNDKQFQMHIMAADVVVDGLIGIGAKGDLQEPFLGVAKAVNASLAKIVALDIPTGVDATSGQILKEAIKADYTLTFGLPKLGLYLHPGASYAGYIIVEQLSFPPQLLEDSNLRGQVTEIKDLAMLKRPLDSHKGTFGKGLLLAGSAGMCGAAAFCGAAALRTGAGVVQAVVKKELFPILQQLVPEMILSEYKPDSEFDLSSYNCLMIGPGWGLSKENASVLKKLLDQAAQKELPVVLDADALTLLAREKLVYKGQLILTPHPGEMSRLTEQNIDKLLQDRIGCSLALAKKIGATVILKGAHTVIALIDGTYYLNPTGNAGMATAGSGDVLTGIIGGVLMQGVPFSLAALTGVYLHGLAGDLAKDSLGSRSIIARDIIEFIPEALKKVYGD